MRTVNVEQRICAVDDDDGWRKATCSGEARRATPVGTFRIEFPCAIVLGGVASVDAPCSVNRHAVGLFHYY